MKNKICERCTKEILEEQKAVTLRTFKGEETIEEVHWHFQCYLDWRDESLENRAKKLFNKTMADVTPKFLEKLKGLDLSKVNSSMMGGL